MWLLWPSLFVACVCVFRCPGRGLGRGLRLAARRRLRSRPGCVCARLCSWRPCVLRLLFWPCLCRFVCASFGCSCARRCGLGGRLVFLRVCFFPLPPVRPSLVLRVRLFLWGRFRLLGLGGFRRWSWRSPVAGPLRPLSRGPSLVLGFVASRPSSFSRPRLWPRPSRSCCFAACALLGPGPFFFLCAPLVWGAFFCACRAVSALRHA